MKKALYDILVFSADPVISESLESILFVINIRPKIIRDYSEIKEKITENTKALLIDEYIIHNGKKEHIKKLYKKYNFKIPILCLIENIPEVNMNNSFIHFFQKPINKNTLNNALMPYLSDASYSNINSIIKLGRFNFDRNLKTLSDSIESLCNLYTKNTDFRIVDISDHKSTCSWAKYVMNRFGPPDFLLNNAAVINQNASLCRCNSFVKIFFDLGRYNFWIYLYFSFSNNILFDWV